MPREVWQALIESETPIKVKVKAWPPIPPLDPRQHGEGAENDVMSQTHNWAQTLFFSEIKERLQPKVSMNEIMCSSCKELVIDEIKNATFPCCKATERRWMEEMFDFNGVVLCPLTSIKASNVLQDLDSILVPSTERLHNQGLKRYVFRSAARAKKRKLCLGVID